MLWRVFLLLKKFADKIWWKEIFKTMKFKRIFKRLTSAPKRLYGRRLKAKKPKKLFDKNCRSHRMSLRWKVCEKKVFFIVRRPHLKLSYLRPETNYQWRTRHEQWIKCWHQIVSPGRLNWFRLSKISSPEERCQEHDKIQKFLRCYSTRFEEGWIFEPFVFGKAANEQLNKRDKCNDVEHRWHTWKWLCKVWW